jgi:uncharacterized protein YrrD
MLRTMKSLRGHRLHGTDGVLGRVDELYFDDDKWIVRYLVADTGHWLPGRLVLISPQSVGRPNWATKELPVSLTRKQIEESPSIETDKPVHRQHERDLHGHFGWTPYWYDMAPVDLAGAVGAAAQQAAGRPAPAEKPDNATHDDPHLRSSREVIGYHVQATDDEIGHVEDFVVDCDDWAVRYMVVDTRNWLPGRKVIVSPAWVSLIQWAKQVVRVDLTRAQVENAPEFDPSAPVNREYEARLYDYYGRPRYW